MTHISTVVYLNDGHAQFFGFNKFAPAQLRETARFDLEILDDVPAQHVIPGALEIIFEQLNIDRPQQPWAIAYRHAGQRSLSVGDVVVLGETAWVCAEVGWTWLGAGDMQAVLPTP